MTKNQSIALRLREAVQETPTLPIWAGDLMLEAAEALTSGHEPSAPQLPRFTVEADGRLIFDDDFGYDAKLTLDGDWPDDGHRKAYAQAVASALDRGNIPTPRASEERTRSLQENP